MSKTIHFLLLMSSAAASPGNLYSVDFDGSDDRVVVSDNNFDGLNTGTIEFWFKTGTDFLSFYKIVFKNNVIDIGINSAGRIFGEISGVGNLGELEAVNHADNTWRHLAFSWDGSDLRGYIDGVFKKKVTQTGTQANNTDALYIGRRDTSEPYPGLIDEFRISDIARYTTETSFVPQTKDFTSDANTLLLLHFNEGSGTTVSDASGNGNTGTLQNGVAWVEDTPY